VRGREESRFGLWLGGGSLLSFLGGAHRGQSLSLQKVFDANNVPFVSLPPRRPLKRARRAWTHTSRARTVLSRVRKTRVVTHESR
jgi:hypothetical protein